MANKNGTLFSSPNLRTNMIHISAKYSGVTLKMAENFVVGETNKTAQYLADFPTGSVPAYKSDAGVCLFDSSAIAFYIANEQLRGGSSLDEYSIAQLCQWRYFAESEILPVVGTWVFDKTGVRKDKEAAKAKEVFKKRMAVLDDYLKSRTFLVGESICLGDIACYCALFPAYEHKMFDAECEKKFVNVHRWYTTCVNQPEAKDVLKCPNKDAKKEAVEGGDDAEPPKKKEVDAFALLPAGSLNMDEWKRTYSNNDFASMAEPWFWEHFDKENYSIWIGEYKPEYAKDLTMVFMTCNLVNGMFQRLDKMRKHAFGSMAVFGEKNNNTIASIWVWRGHKLAFEMDENLQVDYESYNWRKVEPDSSETKEWIKNYWGRNEKTEYDGKKAHSFYVFK